MNEKPKKLSLIVGAFILGLLSSWFYLEVVYGDTPEERTVQKAINKNNDYQKLAQSNVLLQQEINKLKEQLSLIKQKTFLTSGTINDDMEQKAKQNKSSPLLKILTPDFIKSTLSMELKSINRELKKELELSDEQSEKMAKLLQEKVEADVDANAPFLEKISNGGVEDAASEIFSGNSDLKNIFSNAEIQINKNQQDYQEKISSFLTAEQMDKYQSFENKKQQEQYEMMASMESTMVMDEIEFLEEYQKDEITRYFKERASDFPNAKIGSFGSSFSQNRGGSKSDSQSNLQQVLENILTSEQLKKYEESKKILLKILTISSVNLSRHSMLNTVPDCRAIENKI